MDELTTSLVDNGKAAGDRVLKSQKDPPLSAMFIAVTST